MSGKDTVLIVGAGISGLYASIELKTRFPNKAIIVLEKSDRVGGRVLTERWGNFVLEHGPMRFEPQLQPKFANLIETLDIKTTDFSPYTSPDENPDFNKLEVDEIYAISKSKYAPAFALVKYALNIILNDCWDVDVKYIENRELKKYMLKTNAVFNGRYLYEQGIWDVFACVLSKEAIDYLQTKGTFYHMLAINPNAADMICFMLDIIDTANDKLITIKNGSDEIITKLKDKAESLGVNIVLNRKVVKFADDGSLVSVYCHDDERFMAERVMFTLPRNAYMHIKGFSNDVITLMKESVMLLRLFKLFVVFTNPPYNATNIPKVNHNANRIPCRELHYYYDPVTNLGMLQIYGDYPSINFWNAFLRNRATRTSDEVDDEYPHNQLLTNHIQRCLEVLFPTSRNCTIRYFSVINWSNEPFSTGVHFWRPGYRSNVVMQKLGQLGRVHICGETFSTYQGFIEGALISVDNVLQNIEKEI